ncbi:NS1 [Umatilla virus]|uniref:Non-structural protein NS1 n=1 Tax=Umatilla virus TaxID=40060 RepID=G8DP05_9REOV|nr:NS1 [Umatilla virus]AEE98371.1 NS1 [Umatilla virus]
MDAFIRTFGVPHNERPHLHLTWELREILTCSHRLNRCRIYGRCFRENYEFLVEEITRRHDEHAARQLIEESGELCADRNLVWTCANNWKIKGGTINVAADWLNIFTEFNKIHQESVFQSEVTDEAVRFANHAEHTAWTYLDDSTSLLHGFFIPICGDRIVDIVSSQRFGEFLVCYYDPYKANITGVVFREDRQITAALRNILHVLGDAHPSCQTTQAQHRPTQVVFLPRMELLSANERVRVLRTLEMDSKFLKKLKSRESERMFFQKFGVHGRGISDFLTLMLTPLGGVISPVQMQIQRPRHMFQDNFMPMLMLRMLFRGELVEFDLSRPSLIYRYMYQSTATCQCCFLKENGVTSVTLIDTRDRDFQLDEGVRVGRLLNCETTIAFGNVDLQNGEMLTRLGQHWIAIRCSSFTQALLTTLTVMHRDLRGKGYEDIDHKMTALALLGRCYLYWIPNEENAIGLFRAMTMVVLGRSDGNLKLWMETMDLGRFLHMILRPAKESKILRERMHAAMVRLSLHALYVCYGKPFNAFIAPGVIPTISAQPTEIDGLLEGAAGAFGQRAFIREVRIPIDEFSDLNI